MALPKRRISNSRRKNRRSHDALKVAQLVACANCGDMTLPHIMCPSCRMYKGRQILPAFEKDDE